MSRPALFIVIASAGIFLSLNPVNATTFNVDGYQIDRDVMSVKAQRDYRVVKQQKDYTCAASTLATILNYQYGHDYTEQNILNGLLVSVSAERVNQVKKTGFSLLEMKRVVKALGYKAKGYAGVSLEALAKIDYPSIVPVNMNDSPHFVVVKKITDHRVFISDPIWGNRSLLAYEFDKIWNSKTVFFIFPQQGGLAKNQFEAVTKRVSPYISQADIAGRAIQDTWYKHDIDRFVVDVQRSSALEDLIFPF